ncbi:hypothetical protein D3C75_1215210 [compost metagenome]
MHGPDATGKAKGAVQAPLSLGIGVFDMADTFGDVQGGKTTRPGHQAGEQHEKGVMPAVQQNLPCGRQYCGQV